MEINRKFLREHCPDIPWLRKRLTVLRLKGYENDRMSRGEAEACMNDPRKKSETVRRYAEKWRGRAEAVKREAAAYGIDPSLTEDVLFANFAYSMRAEEFMYFDFASKTEEERSAFLSDWEYSELTVRMNNMFDADSFYNKANSYKVMSRYYQREGLPVTGGTSVRDLQAFIDRHPVFVKKRGKSCWGRGVEKIDLSGTKPDAAKLLSKWRAESSEDWLLEELVVQSDAMAAFHPSSVNTIRVITYITKNGVIAPYTFLKTGQHGSFIDNGAAGGILIGVNSETGILDTDGIDEKRNIYITHPDTGVRFKGAALPEWQQAIALCKTMARELPTVKMVGWDLAHTGKGWVLIEANERSQIVGPQIIYDRGLKHELAAIMSRMDLYIPF